MQIHGTQVTRLTPQRKRPPQQSRLPRSVPDSALPQADVGAHDANASQSVPHGHGVALTAGQAEQIYLQSGDLQRFFSSAEDRYARDALAAYAEIQQLAARAASQSMLGVDTYA